MNIETAIQILTARRDAAQADVEALEMALSILEVKYEGDLVSLPSLIQDNADKAATITTLIEEKKALIDEKATLIQDKRDLQGTIANKDAEIAQKDSDIARSIRT